MMKWLFGIIDTVNGDEVTAGLYQEVGGKRCGVLQAPTSDFEFTHILPRMRFIPHTVNGEEMYRYWDYLYKYKSQGAPLVKLNLDSIHAELADRQKNP